MVSLRECKRPKLWDAQPKEVFSNKLIINLPANSAKNEGEIEAVTTIFWGEWKT
jgi:hypothetical protein